MRWLVFILLVAHCDTVGVSAEDRPELPSDTVWVEVPYAYPNPFVAVSDSGVIL